MCIGHTDVHRAEAKAGGVKGAGEGETWAQGGERYGKGWGGGKGGGSCLSCVNKGHMAASLQGDPEIWLMGQRTWAMAHAAFDRHARTSFARTVLYVRTRQGPLGVGVGRRVTRHNPGHNRTTPLS
jgi:hypothetical protein